MTLHHVRPEVLAGRRAASGETVAEVPAVMDKAALLHALATALRFPAWAGRNWDATEELLGDLSWLPGPVTLIWRSPARLRADDPTAYDVAVTVLQNAAERQRRLTVLLVTDDG